MDTLREMASRRFGFAEELTAANEAAQTAQEMLNSAEAERDRALREQARAFELERDTMNAEHVAKIEALNKVFEEERSSLIQTFEEERDALSNEVERTRGELMIFHDEIRRLRHAVEQREAEFEKIMAESESYDKLIDRITELSGTFAERGRELASSAGKLEGESSEISVLALKSAMSAAGLGERGVEYAKTCDAIRDAAAGYEEAAEQIRKRADGLDEDCNETMMAAKKLKQILQDREQRLNGLSRISKFQESEVRG